MKKYKIEFQLNIDQIWFNDGLNSKTLKRKIKEELPGNLCPYATSQEIIVKNIKINLIKK